MEPRENWDLQLEFMETFLGGEVMEWALTERMEIFIEDHEEEWRNFLKKKREKLLAEV